MFTRTAVVCLNTVLLTAWTAAASPFIEGNTPQKNEPKPTVSVSRPQLPTIPLPPLPSLSSDGSLMPLKKRWEYTGTIDNRIIVTDTYTGDILSMAAGERLPGGCLATLEGIYCGKDAAEKKRTLRSEQRTVDPAQRLDELIFSAQNIASKCSQLDDTLKSELLRTTLVLQERDNKLSQASQELETQKKILEQLTTERDGLQEQLQSIRNENVKFKEDSAFLLTTIALLKQQKGTPYNLPGAEGRIFKGNNGNTTILLNLKETAGETEPDTPTDSAVPDAEMIDRRDK
ncbi:hypothetical protein [Trichlorobacter sp.]|uniref:hypothetical protein n=1 Tax=Trichlorobacter sp. TaxID=2911007 RepID=UPI002A35BE69|nr:hypothetical protein [Trichlorobacter sp.]MDY0383720.1 hypothetical protein [Trichlorobacter sp.]